jgi:hypothetical protein
MSGLTPELDASPLPIQKVPRLQATHIAPQFSASQFYPECSALVAQRLLWRHRLISQDRILTSYVNLSLQLNGRVQISRVREGCVSHPGLSPLPTCFYDVIHDHACHGRVP